MTERVFPPSFSPSGVLRCEGMTLRDHFASLAMQGMLSSNHFVNNDAIILSQDAYIIADAMLKQRSL